MMADEYARPFLGTPLPPTPRLSSSRARMGGREGALRGRARPPPPPPPAPLVAASAAAPHASSSSTWGSQHPCVAPRPMTKTTQGRGSEAGVPSSPGRSPSSPSLAASASSLERGAGEGEREGGPAAAVGSGEADRTVAGAAALPLAPPDRRRSSEANQPTAWAATSTACSRANRAGVSGGACCRRRGTSRARGRRCCARAWRTFPPRCWMAMMGPWRARPWPVSSAFHAGWAWIDCLLR